MENKRVLVGMSGGVDSSVCAMLLRDAGFDVAGATLHLFDNEDIGLPAGRACCSLEDVEDARQVAAKIGVPFSVYNFKEDFSRCVIDRFAAEYASGRTPNPCIDCNRTIKFAKLLERADMLGFGHIATGHYAGVAFDEKRGRYVLKKGKDKRKDQSYVLYPLTQEQLSRLFLPLGEYEKSAVRAMAAARGLINSGKPDSQDICFVPDGDYASFLKRRGVAMEPGNFVDEKGRVLGRHRGLAAYTAGQRKGLGIGGSDFPLYVLRKDEKRNAVVLGPEEALYSSELVAENVNWVSAAEPSSPFRVTAKTRYSQSEAPATAYPLGGGRVRVVFDNPQRALTRGQSAVLYDGDELVAGGVIAEI